MQKVENWRYNPTDIMLLVLLLIDTALVGVTVGLGNRAWDGVAIAYGAFTAFLLYTWNKNPNYTTMTTDEDMIDLKKADAAAYERQWHFIFGKMPSSPGYYIQVSRGFNLKIGLDAYIPTWRALCFSIKLGHKHSERGCLVLSINLVWLWLNFTIKLPNNFSFLGQKAEKSCYLIDLSMHHYGFWWHLGTVSDINQEKYPFWRSGNWQFVDWLLGPLDVRFKLLSLNEKAVIPLPESHYYGTLKLERVTIRRKRWPFLINNFVRGDFECNPIHPFGIRTFQRRKFSTDNKLDGGVQAYSFVCLDEPDFIGGLVTRILRLRQGRSLDDIPNLEI